MSKTSAKELEARKQAARLQEQDRRWREAKLAEREEWTADQLWDELDLRIPPKEPPAVQFLLDRMKGDASTLDDEMHRAMVDLLRGDMPLDPRSRQWIADLFERLAFPNRAKEAQRKRRVEAAAAALMKRHYQERGMTALKAEQAVAENLGLSVDALRKKMQRARK